MTVHEFIDVPQSRECSDPLLQFAGWCAAEGASWEKATIRVNGRNVPFAPIPRPDVSEILPGFNVLGFSGLLPPESGTAEVQLLLEGQQLCTWSITVPAALVAHRLRMEEVRQQKTDWCLRHVLRGPSTPGRGALNYLTPELWNSCSLIQSSNISSNSYSEAARATIREVADLGGMVLDCGAGWRPEIHPSVVNLEIVDYPSTDVLAVGQSLPFEDNVFDAVISYDVLEHVNDPFACAREIIRVLKPGGRLCCDVPFLQPEHGYPHHFYNMTREGLRNLFRPLDIEHHEVPWGGEPIVSLRWFVDEYRHYLKKETREQFLNMSMRDLLSRGTYEWNDSPIVRDLQEEGRWKLACTTTIIARKPASIG